MKNIADVNSDDILTELNSLDYDESDDLKLLDDEDIRPINNNQSSSNDLSSFYSAVDKKEVKNTVDSNLDLYTEKPKDDSKRIEKYIEKANKLIEQPKTTNTTVVKNTSNIDNYLNRDMQKVEVNDYNKQYII